VRCVEHGSSSRRCRAPDFPPAQQFACVAFCVLATAVFSLYLFKPWLSVPASIGVAAGSLPTATSQADPNVAQPPAALSQAITAAAEATSWPKLNPPLDHLDTKSAQASWHGCRSATEATLSGCTFGDTGNTLKVAVVLGDSVAMAWLPAIRAALVPQHWLVYGLAKEECPAAFVSVLDEQRPPKHLPDCDSRHAWVISETARLKPSLVILASSPTLDRLASKATGSAAEAEWQGGMKKTMNALRADGKPRILTLSAPPSGKSLQWCATAVASPGDCLGDISPKWQTTRTAEAAAATATATAYADTSLWFCTDYSGCPSFVGSTPVFWDGGHMTNAYASSLGPEMAGVVAKVMK
jgi:SGNH domain (fused to AT3 domains)